MSRDARSGRATRTAPTVAPRC